VIALRKKKSISSPETVLPNEEAKTEEPVHYQCRPHDLVLQKNQKKNTAPNLPPTVQIDSVA